MEIIFKIYVTVAIMTMFIGIASLDSESILIPMLIMCVGILMLVIPTFLANRKRGEF